ncbi:uncharacterized protein BO72DRAFT_107781 [Aspergillus fijiensis CBS 313.89]|uniref:DUF7582 domain-containing protein n=1 Tax=Aspergillus fijiensis CBS 313.89 TaxID=1448319 RepID=A0A8G1VZ85_9EURO|nr:uncharacterized protein BO72DRAFT_107781 [Aspergillus fijiensis CBS 313.89]RAK77238.1 hypothetical protein BO72DRAFT_107781 [Aspergillus fijiensis CBS 313.89]
MDAANDSHGSQGLTALDREVGSDEFIVAFAPIRPIAAGGFLAVTYLRSRESTGDIDYLRDLEFAGDQHIQVPLQKAIRSVARQKGFTNKWINEDMAIFVTKKARQTLFEEAEKQNIVLFSGENLEVLAAPLEWALERKLRRIHAADRGRKAECDMEDALALLKALKLRNKGPLDQESVRRMNMNGFDVLPSYETMQRVSREYQQKYNEDIFK